MDALLALILDNDLLPLMYFLIFILGLLAGSFANVLIHRLPREDLNVNRPARSFCPGCGAAIHFFDNIPVVSWLILHGKCRACGRAISARYPLVELASGFLALYLFHRFGFSLHFPGFFYFALCLLAVAFIDLEHMVIPTVLIYPAAALGLLLALIEPLPCSPFAPAVSGLFLPPEIAMKPGAPALADSLAGLALGYGLLKIISLLYKKIRGHDGLGDGDPLLLGLMGIFLGWASIPFIVFLSALLGLSSVGLLALKATEKPPQGWSKLPIPFGPFLVLAAFFYLFFGPRLIGWYFSLIMT
jgi:leader peptidase (prepilin peptidase)/N-methyltransferase